MGCGTSAEAVKSQTTPVHLQKPFDDNGERNLHDFYEVEHVIGQGSVAKCKRGIEKTSRKPFAIKILDRKSSEFDYDGLRLEIEVMRKVDHPGCVKLFDVFEDKKHVYLIQELASGGELFDRVSENGAYSEADAATLFKQVMEAVAHLHSMGICHRDLKPENVLMKSDDRNSSAYNVVKLADFGLSTFKADDYNDTMVTACGTPEYIAPEIIVTLKEGGSSSRTYSAKVDVWAAGVILYVMLCGFQPFQLESQNAMYQAIQYGRFSFPSPEWDVVSQEAKDYIKTVLQVKPSKRPTAADCLKHPWIKQVAFGRTESLGINENLKQYNANLGKKRFKKAVNVVTAVKRMQLLTSGSSSSILAAAKAAQRAEQVARGGASPEAGPSDSEVGNGEEGPTDSPNGIGESVQ
mmetsp:Transcript_68672/g.143297  ORF Transcript_68672/g.143297 Transcript_68672/m.143297 type:complete len:407 (+) Transcript_68672:163-1383(+)